MFGGAQAPREYSGSDGDRGAIAVRYILCRASSQQKAYQLQSVVQIIVYLSKGDVRRWIGRSMFL